MYERKTVDVWVIQGNYGDGWEDLVEYYDRNEARADAKSYRDNDSAPIRIIKRREKRKDKEELLTVDALVGICMKKAETSDNLFDAKYAYEEMIAAVAIGKEKYFEGFDGITACLIARIVFKAWQEDRWGEQGVEEVLKCRGTEEQGGIDIYARRVGRQILDTVVAAFERGAE